MHSYGSVITVVDKGKFCTFLKSRVVHTIYQSHAARLQSSVTGTPLVSFLQNPRPNRGQAPHLILDLALPGSLNGGWHAGTVVGPVAAMGEVMSAEIRSDTGCGASLLRDSCC
jgi:hypothetical protein